MKKLEATWVIAWGLLLGFGTGSISMIVIGHIAWSWVGLAALGGWLLGWIVARFVNNRSNHRQTG
jgi:hypothetical protein